MSNDAGLSLRVYGKSKDVVRFMEIIYDLDKEYIIYAQNETGSSYKLIDDQNGMSHADFYCVVGNCSEYLSCPSEYDFDKRYNKKPITFLDASRLFNLTMEWYCEECGSEFNEYFSVSNGHNIVSVAIYWADPGVFEDDFETNVEMFEGYVEEALSAGVPLDMKQVKDIRKNNYDKLTKLDCFSFGGYEWDFHTLDEILNGVIPKIRKDIRRD